MGVKWHHVALAVSDIEKCKRFYCDFLGFEIDWERDLESEKFAKIVGLEGASAHAVMLKGHGARVELFLYHNPTSEKLPERRQCDFGLTHFALQVDDIQGMYDKLISSGVVFNCPPVSLRPGALATYMKDPEGNVIELVEYS